ncbi:lipopolysaccharide biosynthesis protein [Qipengyuania sp. RANM35]|uniref:lipopolysaccharide biosynthesis protein n=1 Tax=Qipengyuania sp. RANM35 TaxID=3068635 RepID=UPI0034DB5E30
MARDTRNQLYSFIREGAAVGLLRAGAVLAMLAFVACTSNWLPAADFGVLALLVSFTTLAAGFGGFGQAEMIIRSVAHRRVDGDEAPEIAVPNEVIGLVTWVSTIFGLAIAVYLKFAGYPGIVCIAALLMTIGLSVMTALTGAARISNRYALAMAPREIVWRAVAILALGSLAALGRRPEIGAAAILVGSSIILCALWQARRLQVKWSSLLKPSTDALQKSYLVSSGTIAVSMLALVAMNTVDVIVVGERISADAAAAYFPANRLALLASFASMPIQLVVEQRFAAELATNDRMAMQRTANQATMLHFILCLSLGLCVVGGFPFYEGLFPTADLLTLKLLAILVAGTILSSLLGMSGSILVMAGHQVVFAKTTIIAAICATALLLVAASAGNLLIIAAVFAGVELTRKAVLAVHAYRLTGILPIARLRL